MEPKRTTPFRGDLLKDLRDPTEATNYVVACATEGAADVGVRDVMEAARLQERARCVKIARDAREQAAASECGRMDGECCVSWMEHVAAKIEAGHA